MSNGAASATAATLTPAYQQSRIMIMVRIVSFGNIRVIANLLTCGPSFLPSKMRRRGNMTRESNHRGFAGTRACPLNVQPDRKAGDARKRLIGAEKLRTDANRSVKRGVATRLSMVWSGQDRPASSLPLTAGGSTSFPHNGVSFLAGVLHTPSNWCRRQSYLTMQSDSVQTSKRRPGLIIKRTVQ